MYLLRSNETEEARQKRKEHDKNAQQKRYNALSPNSKRMKNQKRTENRRLKRNQTKIASVNKQEITPIVQSKIEIVPIVEEPKLSEYEQIRQRNIEERKNLFQKMKELKAQAAVGIPKNKTSKKH